MKRLKKRIASNYGEILEMLKYDSNISNVSNYKGTNRGKIGFDYYNVNLAFPIRDSKKNIVDYKFYEARLVVRKETNGNFAYDLDKFIEKKGTILNERVQYPNIDNSDINNTSQSDSKSN